MREILFRAKRIDNGEWVYGYYTMYVSDCGGIYPCVLTETKRGKINPVHIDRETVGQYTGLTDKNGAKIFEGDVMQLCSATYPCLVYWDGRGFAWLQNGKRREIDLTREKMEIVGNIHDNQELLKGGDGE